MTYYRSRPADRINEDRNYKMNGHHNQRWAHENCIAPVLKAVNALAHDSCSIFWTIVEQVSHWTEPLGNEHNDIRRQTLCIGTRSQKGAIAWIRHESAGKENGLTLIKISLQSVYTERMTPNPLRPSPSWHRQAGHPTVSKIFHLEPDG